MACTAASAGAPWFLFPLPLAAGLMVLFWSAPSDQQE